MNLLWEISQSQYGQVRKMLVKMFRFLNMITFPYDICTLDSRKQLNYYNQHFLFENVLSATFAQVLMTNLGERFRIE